MKKLINELAIEIHENRMNVVEAVDYVEKHEMDYGIEYFSPYLPEHAPYWDMLKEWKRRQKNKAPAPVAGGAYIPKKEGQVWEPCERCGREPAYMPLHLCDKCWPK